MRSIDILKSKYLLYNTLAIIVTELSRFLDCDIYLAVTETLLDSTKAE